MQGLWKVAAVAGKAGQESWEGESSRETQQLDMDKPAIRWPLIHVVGSNPRKKSATRRPLGLEGQSAAGAHTSGAQSWDEVVVQVGETQNSTRSKGGPSHQAGLARSLAVSL